MSTCELRVKILVIDRDSSETVFTGVGINLPYSLNIKLDRSLNFIAVNIELIKFVL